MIWSDLTGTFLTVRKSQCPAECGRNAIEVGRLIYRGTKSVWSLWSWSLSHLKSGTFPVFNAAYHQSSPCTRLKTVAAKVIAKTNSPPERLTESQGEERGRGREG